MKKIARILLITFVLYLVGTLSNVNYLNLSNAEKVDTEREDETMLKIEKIEKGEMSEEELRKEASYDMNSKDIGAVEFKAVGDLKTDIYLIVQNEQGHKGTIYISPKRENKNDRDLRAGKYLVKGIYLLDEDYKDYYKFKYNNNLIVFPNEKVYYDIEVIGKKENTEKDELLEGVEESKEEVVEKEDEGKTDNIKSYLFIGGGVILIIAIFIILKKSRVFLKNQ